jgi:hypothetical protein
MNDQDEKMVLEVEAVTTHSETVVLLENKICWCIGDSNMDDNHPNE